MANIRTFSKTGKALSGVQRAGIATSPLGHFDPNTGIIWQHPRLKGDKISGPRVSVSNPNASLDGPRNQMTASLGMGGVGQRGRNRDVGSAKAKGES